MEVLVYTQNVVHETIPMNAYEPWTSCSHFLLLWVTFRKRFSGIYYMQQVINVFCTTVMCMCIPTYTPIFFSPTFCCSDRKKKIKAHTENEMLDTKKKKLRKWKCKMYLGCWVECVCVICVHVRVSPSLVLYEHAHAGCCKRLRKSVYDFPFIAHAVPHYCRTVAGSASAIVICVFYSLLYYYTRRVGRSSYII